MSAINTVWNGMLGKPLGTNPTPAAQANTPWSQASMSQAQLAGMAQQQFNAAYNAYAQQGMNQQYAANQYAAQQQQAFNNVWQERRWQIDGRYMTLKEFVDYIWPEDCAEKTFFLLKHTKETVDE